jgi:hypothetical protein
VASLFGGNALFSGPFESFNQMTAALMSTGTLTEIAGQPVAELARRCTFTMRPWSFAG